jgi:hypothetical protein
MNNLIFTISNEKRLFLFNRNLNKLLENNFKIQVNFVLIYHYFVHILEVFLF